MNTPMRAHALDSVSAQRSVYSVAVAIVVCPSHAGIVLKRINISSNFSLRLLAPPQCFSSATYGCIILTGRGARNPSGLRYFRSKNA